MRPRSRWIAALTLVPAFLAACSETPPTGVELTTAGPLLQISDAANTGGRTGFYFLPPMVPDPGPFTGTFDTNLSPEVRVCQLAGSACGTTIKTFTTTTTEPVEVSVPRQTYGVNWSTKNNPSSIATNNKYRIEIRVGTQLLGFADLAFVKTSKDLASLPAGTVGGGARVAAQRQVPHRDAHGRKRDRHPDDRGDRADRKPSLLGRGARPARRRRA